MNNEQFTTKPDLQGRTWTYTIEQTGIGTPNNMVYSWEVLCWNDEIDECHWARRFHNYDLAKAEFERWRTR